MTEIVQVEERMPWERQKGETAKQFEAFVIFRSLEPRTIREAARLKAEPTKRNVDTVDRQFKAWAAKWSWWERVEAFDLWIDRRRVEARETERQRIDREHREEGRFLRALGFGRLSGEPGPDGKPMKAIDWDEVDPATALNVYVKGRDGERQAAGLALGGSIGLMPVSQARQVVQEVFETMLELVPEDLRSTAYSRVQAIADGR